MRTGQESFEYRLYYIKIHAILKMAKNNSGAKEGKSKKLNEMSCSCAISCGMKLSTYHSVLPNLRRVRERERKGDKSDAEKHAVVDTM